ncbi:aldose 1-epimerase [Pseudozobellia thermophila]|uniref:Galactose mutarotase n=1 Tax=Pseudozobellia thermophila TaxID=192903 RepID=A0A1M6M990_9FLAO|nr:aldose 1-epimerase [Pseudozobellia thermophila]SHJ80036.1 Galactose mutarotase [Pseudozobellia thermophila]
MVTLKFENQEVKVDAGELVGYQVDGLEFIHQKGEPGWRNADTEMFPIIGPTAEARFQVQTPRDIAVQDQHGLLREMDYELVEQNGNTALFRKEYKARTPVLNSKYPEKSNKKYLFWTYDFGFEKRFDLSGEGLSIAFTVKGERDTPFMLGYHPAFKLYTDTPEIIVKDKSLTLQEVLDVGSRALHVPDCEEIVLKDREQLRIRTEGFGNFMLWTEVRNMVCIEPITFYPYAVDQHRLHEGFQFLKDSEKTFKVHINKV